MTGTVQRRLLNGWFDPTRVFAALYAEQDYAFWLDAGPVAHTGVSYLGAASPHSRVVTASVPHGTVTSIRLDQADAGPPVVTRESIFDFLRREAQPTENTASAAADTGVGGLDGEPTGFDLGWVGWFGYELGAQTVDTPTHKSRYPDAVLLEVHRLVRFDHRAGTVTLVARRTAHESAATLATWFERTTAALARTRTMIAPHTAPVAAAPVVGEWGVRSPEISAPVLWRHDAVAYAALIERCLLAIRAGDAYQLCLTNEITVPGSWNPAATYERLRRHSPSHHGGLLQFGEVALLSSSPEQFLHVDHNRRIRTKPIKGTRPRSADRHEDERLKRELQGSDKERAENLMIVDLMRNDLARIAALGTVVVSTLMAVESYPHVHQLVSTIDATLAPGTTVIDAVEACFPAGSMTGAPKRSAMALLDGLEGAPRGIYSGAFGYIGDNGQVDLAIVIRSIVLDSEGASIGTGGGITALSTAAEEIEETRVKAAALLAALGAAAP